MPECKAGAGQPDPGGGHRERQVLTGPLCPEGTGSQEEGRWSWGTHRCHQLLQINED